MKKAFSSILNRRQANADRNKKQEVSKEVEPDDQSIRNSFVEISHSDRLFRDMPGHHRKATQQHENTMLSVINQLKEKHRQDQQKQQNNSLFVNITGIQEVDPKKEENQRSRQSDMLNFEQKKPQMKSLSPMRKMLRRKRDKPVQVQSSSSSDDENNNKHVTNSMIETGKNLNLVKTKDNQIKFIPMNQLQNQNRRISGNLQLKKNDSQILTKTIEKKASITSNKSGISSIRGSQVSLNDKKKHESPKNQKQQTGKTGQFHFQMPFDGNKNNPLPEQQLPDRADVTQMDCNMYNLVDILEQAYKYMQIVKNEDVVVCIGYTGSGKSTLFSYLAFGGRQGVVEQTVQHYVKIGLTNKQKLKKRKVIGNSVDNGIFKIGHSECESETFFPTFWKDEKSNLLYCDIAGAGESGPHLIRLVNHFTLHFLINKVKSLKILLLITYLQLIDSRGIKVSQIVREAMNLVESDLEKINGYSSIFQPIISSKNITQNTNFNIDFARFDLKLILDKHIFEKLQIEQQDSKEQGNDMDNMIFNGNTTNDYLSIQSTADGLGQIQDNNFSSKFSNKLILFDPLETPFLSDQGIDQTIKHEELVQIIHKMDCYKRQPQKQQLHLLKSFLNKDEDSKDKRARYTKYITMSYELEEKLDFMFERLERELREVRQKHEEFVREKLELMQPLFSEDPKVLAMRTVYDFFLEYNLLCKEQLNSRCTEFFNYISDVELSLENILFYNTQQEHEPNEFQNLLDLLIASNYEQIVPKLIMYYKLIEKLKQELTLVTASKVESGTDFNFRGSVNYSTFQSVGTSKIIQDDMNHPDKFQQLIIVSEAYLLVILDRIVSNQETLHQFAYHLRKVDNESNFFTKIFLVGRVKPILLELYLSNTWVKTKEDNSYQGQFVPNDDVLFSIKHLNSIQDMTIQYVQSTKDEQVVYASPIGKNTDFFQFVLAEDGFQIVTKSTKASSKKLDDSLQNQQILVPKQSNFETSENDLMLKSMKNPNLSNSSDMNQSQENAQKKNKNQASTTWRLVAKQLDDDDAIFFIELAQQGRQNPRLITHGKKSQSMRSESVISASNSHDKNCLCNKLIVTRKYTMGTEKHDRLGLWEIWKHDKKQTIADSISMLDISSKPIFKMDASTSVYASVAAQPKVYEMLLGYTQVIERQIPSYNLNQNFILKLQAKLKCLLDKIFEEGSDHFDQPTEIFIRYLKRGFQFQEVRTCFFDYFSTIVKETRVANKIALFTLQELIDHHIQKLYENLGYCTLFDLDKFIQASLLIWCKREQTQESPEKQPDLDDSLTRDRPLLIECIGDSGDENEDCTAKVDMYAKNRQNFLKIVKKMVPQKIFLNEFLVQARSDVRSIKNTNQKTKRRITVQQADIQEQSVFMQPVVWIEVIKMHVEKELDQEQNKNKRVNIFQKLMDRVIGKEAFKGKLSKYKLLIRCFHLYLLRFGLPRDVINQILLSDEHKLKPKETKKLQIYLDMVYYWRGLKNVTSVEIPHRVTKELNLDFEPINIESSEKDYNFEKLEESYFEYIFEDQDDLWFKKQKQLKMLPNQEELKKLHRSEEWLRILQIRDHYHEFGLEKYMDTESNWKKLFGNNHQKQVNNMLQFSPFKHSDSSLINLILKEEEQDDESVIQKHISILNSLLKSFALKQNIKSMSEIEKYKDLVVFVYQMMRVEKNDKKDSSNPYEFLEETLQDFDDIEDGYGLATQIDKFQQLQNYNKVFKLIVHLATMNGLYEMICDSSDFVLRFILYEFDSLVAIHLPELQKHFQELNVSWCSVFGLQWYKRMLSIFILKNFNVQQMQESKACVFQIWDAVIEACAQSDFVPWSLFHQLSLYILALHQQILLNIDNEEALLNTILQATRSILKADSHELDEIEEYYFSNVEQNENYEIPEPYWNKIEQDNTLNIVKLDTKNKESSSKSKRKQTSTRQSQVERPCIHISERLASCFQQDRNGKKMDIIGQLSNIRKDLLNLHVKKYQRSNIFQFNFLRSSKPTKNTVDPVDLSALPLQEKEQDSIHREIFGNSPMLRPDVISHGPAFNALSAKAKDTRKACEMILNQIYEI